MFRAVLSLRKWTEPSQNRVLAPPECQLDNPIVPLKPGVTVNQAKLQGTTGVNPNNPVLNSSDFAQCPSAPSGPGGMSVDTASSGSLQPISVAGTTNNHTSVVMALDGRLMVLAQTSCPGSSALIWLNPSTGATQTLLPAAASQVGVVSAVPYGNGPTAISG